jgi:hypothetical protein
VPVPLGWSKAKVAAESIARIAASAVTKGHDNTNDPGALIAEIVSPPLGRRGTW